MKTLPYLQWTKESNLKDGGVIYHNSKKSSPGYNVYHNNTNTVYLMDMAGDIKHTWTIKNVERFRVVKPIKDGNLIVVGDTIFRLDWDSTLLWEASVYGHHDFAFLPDESFYTQRLK